MSTIDEINKQIEKVAEEIGKVAEEIGKVAEKIGKVETAIEGLENDSATKTNNHALRLEQLQNDKKQLQDKENKLRDKENKLRDEKNELVKQRSMLLLSTKSVPTYKFHKQKIMYTSEGLPDLHVKRTQLVNEIIKMSERNRYVLFSAPPFSGKSSISQLLCERFTHNNTEYQIVSFACFMPESGLEEIETYFKEEVKSDLNDVISQENTILIIDDAQNIYHIDKFWAKFKAANNKPKCRLIVFSTMGLRSSLGNILTPMAFDEVVQYESIKFSRDEFDQLRNIYLNGYKVSEIKKKMYTETVWNRLFTLIDGHPGLSAFSFRLLISDFPKKHEMDSEQKVLDMFDNSVLHLELFRQRCFRPIHELVNYVAEMTRNTKICTRSFFEKIKNPSFKEEIKNILGELVHKLALNFDKKNVIHYYFLKFGVCILSGTEMKFSCPISAVYYFQNYYQYFLDRKDLKRECSNFEEFILESISLFDPIALRNSFSKKINKSLNEAIYHHEMYRCMHLICDKTVSAQVGSWFGIRGAIDLYVNSTYKYAIELVKDGSLLEQHQSRFIGNGNYANIDINKYALIDFYEDASIRIDKRSMKIDGPIPEYKSDSNYYKVIFVEDFAYFIVLHDDSKPVIRATKNQINSTLKYIVKNLRKLI